jgi:hypothetical protein
LTATRSSLLVDTDKVPALTGSDDEEDEADEDDEPGTDGDDPELAAELGVPLEE